MTVKKGMLLSMFDSLGDNADMELAALSPQVMALMAANVEYNRRLDVVQAENAEYRRKLSEEQALRWQQNAEKLAAYTAEGKPLPWWQNVILYVWTLLYEAWGLVKNRGSKK